MRQLIIDLLDDEYGVNTTAWNQLRDLLEEDNEDGINDDILNAVKSADGRWYLPEGWNG